MSNSIQQPLLGGAEGLQPPISQPHNNSSHRIDLSSQDDQDQPPSSTTSFYPSFALSSFTLNIPVTVKFWLSVLLVVLSSAAEQILRKKLATTLLDFRWFLVQLLALGAFIISLILILNDLRKPEHSLRSVFQNLAPRTMLYLAFLDTLHSLLLILSIGVLPAPLTISIPLVLAPLTVALRFFSSGCRGRNRNHQMLTGVGLAFLGWLLTMIPSITHWTSCFPLAPPPLDDIPPSALQLWIHAGFLVLSLMPAGLSSARKDAMLARLELNGNGLNLVLSFLSLLVGFVLSPIFLQLQALTAQKDMNPLSNLAAGYHCLQGIDTHHATFDTGSMCAEDRGPLLTKLISYFIAIFLFHSGLTELLERISRPNQITVTLAAGSILALVWFVIPTFIMSCTTNYLGLLGIILTLVGCCILDRDAVLTTPEINLWAVIEGLERKDQTIAQARRKSKRRSRNRG